jgi:hypothetical protein
MQTLKLTFTIWLLWVGLAWAGAVPMRVMGTWLLNNGDRMSTLGPTENPPGIFEGQLFYLNPVPEIGIIAEREKTA